MDDHRIGLSIPIPMTTKRVITIIGIVFIALVLLWVLLVVNLHAQAAGGHRRIKIDHWKIRSQVDERHYRTRGKESCEKVHATVAGYNVLGWKMLAHSLSVTGCWHHGQMTEQHYNHWDYTKSIPGGWEVDAGTHNVVKGPSVPGSRIYRRDYQGFKTCVWVACATKIPWVSLGMTPGGDWSADCGPYDCDK